MTSFRLAASALALALAPAFPAAAATMAHPHVAIAHPINVSACNPSRNSYMATGYRPAYYPGGRYWGWPSVYGYSYYQYPVRGNPTLGIDYHNATNVTMTTIEFGLIARNQLVAEVRDVGTFSPGAEIKHEFGLNPNVFPLGTSMVRCIPLKIQFADGTRWKNPHLPALHRSIYGRPHY